MASKKVLLMLAVAGIAFGACSNSKTTSADSTAVDTSITDTALIDSSGKDTSDVKQADSTHSFRNDRGTDSVSSGKSVPAKP